MYWVRLKGSYVVARIFHLLLLNSSAWPCLGPVLLSKTFKPFRPTQYTFSQVTFKVRLCRSEKVAQVKKFYLCGT